MLRLVTLGRFALQREGVPPEMVVLQPKRLALLTYLALSSDGSSHRRDILLTLFWPERKHTEARHALRHALYHLRNVLGDGAIVSRGSEEVELVKRMWCDARAFEDTFQAGRAADALALYRGEFLAGVFVAGASPDWDEWVSRTRARLRSRAAAAAWTVAELAIWSGDISRGLDAARRARELDPDDEPGLRRLMGLFNHVGRRTAALQVYSDFSRRMRGEYQTEPSPETKALADTIRSLEGPTQLVRESVQESNGAAMLAGPTRRPQPLHSINAWRLRAAVRRRQAQAR